MKFINLKCSIILLVVYCASLKAQSYTFVLKRGSANFKGEKVQSGQKYTFGQADKLTVNSESLILFLNKYGDFKVISAPKSYNLSAINKIFPKKNKYVNAIGKQIFQASVQQSAKSGSTSRGAEILEPKVQPGNNYKIITDSFLLVPGTENIISNVILIKNGSDDKIIINKDSLSIKLTIKVPGTYSWSFLIYQGGDTLKINNVFSIPDSLEKLNIINDIMVVKDILKSCKSEYRDILLKDFYEYRQYYALKNDYD